MKGMDSDCGPHSLKQIRVPLGPFLARRRFVTVWDPTETAIA